MGIRTHIWQTVLRHGIDISQACHDYLIMPNITFKPIDNLLNLYGEPINILPTPWQEIFGKFPRGVEKSFTYDKLKPKMNL